MARSAAVSGNCTSFSASAKVVSRNLGSEGGARAEGRRAPGRKLWRDSVRAGARQSLRLSTPKDVVLRNLDVIWTWFSLTGTKFDCTA